MYSRNKMLKNRMTENVYITEGNVEYYRKKEMLNITLNAANKKDNVMFQNRSYYFNIKIGEVGTAVCTV